MTLLISQENLFLKPNSGSIQSYYFFLYLVQLYKVRQQYLFFSFFTLQQLNIPSNMIIEPVFPTSFNNLITAVVIREISVDKAKGKINSLQGRSLFDSIDYLKVGEVFLEDIYAYLKTKGLILSKRQLKFINRYFGFSSHQKLNFLQFKQKFLYPQSKIIEIQQEIPDYEQLFVNLIKLSVDSYNQIEKLRSIVSENVSQLEDCFKLYYPQSPYSINKPVLQEILAILGLYSRLSFTLLAKYIIGDQAQEVTIRQLFWNSSFVSQNYTQDSKSQQKNQYQLFEATERSKASVSKIVANKNMDILAQIQNIEASIRLKQEKNAKDKFQFQGLQNTIVNKQDRILSNLVQRSSQSNLNSYFAKQSRKMSRTSKFKKAEISEVTSNEKQKDNLEQILKRSLKSYEESDLIEERQAQIQQLLKVRTKRRTREEVLTRASSAAKLKIQQIEKRVFSKSKILPSTVQSSALKTPANLILNHETKSRNTSLKRR